LKKKHSVPEIAAKLREMSLLAREKQFQRSATISTSVSKPVTAGGKSVAK